MISAVYFIEFKRQSVERMNMRGYYLYYHLIFALNINCLMKQQLNSYMVDDIDFSLI